MTIRDNEEFQFLHSPWAPFFSHDDDTHDMADGIPSIKDEMYNKFTNTFCNPMW